MKLKTMTLLTAACMLALTGCMTGNRPLLQLGPIAEVTTTWAKMGTPARIVDLREVDVLVLVKGKWTRTKARLDGMIAIDEPTLEYYRELDKKYGSGKRMQGAPGEADS